MQREKCIECGRTLRNYKKGEKRCHRSCWIKMRDKDDRRFDFLFCKDRPMREMKKCIVVSPLEKMSPKASRGGATPSPTDELINQVVSSAESLTSSPSSTPPPPLPSPVELKRS